MRYSIIGIAWVCKALSTGSNPVGAFDLINPKFKSLIK